MDSIYHMTALFKIHIVDRLSRDSTAYVFRLFTNIYFLTDQKKTKKLWPRVCSYLCVNRTSNLRISSF